MFLIDGKPWWLYVTTAIEEADFTIGTTPTRIALADPYVIAAIFSNTGGGAITLGNSAHVTTTGGIELPTNDRPFQINGAYEGPLAAREWWAVGAAAGATLHIIRTRIVG